MASPERSGSHEVVEATDTTVEGAKSTVTAEQWRAIRTIIESIYAYREKDGHDPSKLFQRIVNKSHLPDYFTVIQEPRALSTLKKRCLSKDYPDFATFVRDAALIVHNAQTYNRPKSIAFQDSLIVKGLFEKAFSELVEQGMITEEEAKFPYLGELPSNESLSADEEDDEEEEAGEEEEDEEDEEEEEEADESEEETVGRKRKRRSSAAAPSKRRATSKTNGVQTEARKGHGRPPKVDTPLEARIRNVLRGIRRIKSGDRLIYVSFEKLPDKAQHPQYYTTIKEPLSLEQIKRKSKRKKYNAVDHFVKDMDHMFNNCKNYNEPDSELYHDAVALQNETHRLAEEERAKPDDDFAMEEGRKPLPNGIQHNNETWKVGDWIHLRNENDPTKPIIAQIYRTWSENNGENWINACWYYRPEQTVHQHEKHFFPAEVVKTGRYCDHRAEDILDRCFVMFVTRYSRGRPRGLGNNKDVYICESRYNEDKHRMNKIKTWASCLPDEVRDRDYEMDLFDRPKKVKKVPSPLLHLLKDDEKDVGSKKPKWGNPSAPPVVGAIYRGPRDENQSPPPEPTPSPPPQPPPPVAKAPRLSYNTDFSPNIRKNSVSSGLDRNMNANVPNYAYRTVPQHQYHPQVAATPHAVNHHHPPYPPQAANSYRPNYDNYAAAAPSPHQTTSTQTTTPSLPRRSQVSTLPERANMAIPTRIRDFFHCDDSDSTLWFDSMAPQPQSMIKTDLLPKHSAKYLAKVQEADTNLAQRLKSNTGVESEAATSKSANKAVMKFPEGAGLEGQHLTSMRSEAILGKSAGKVAMEDTRSAAGEAISNAADPQQQLPRLSNKEWSSRIMEKRRQRKAAEESEEAEKKRPWNAEELALVNKWGAKIDPPMTENVPIGTADDERLYKCKLKEIEELTISNWQRRFEARTNLIWMDLYGEHWEVGKHMELEKLADRQAAHQKKQDEQAERIAARKRKRVEMEVLSGPGCFKDDWDPRY